MWKEYSELQVVKIPPRGTLHRLAEQPLASKPWAMPRRHPSAEWQGADAVLCPHWHFTEPQGYSFVLSLLF